MIRFAPFALLLSCGSTSAEAGSFYKESPLFSTAPDEKAFVNTITRFGPVGLAIELHQPAFTLWAGAIEPGSPAEAVLRKAATFVPMLSSAWQELQNPQNPPADPDEGKFRYDGKFVPNPKVAGTWTTVALVKSAAEFDPKAKPRPDRSPIRDITLNEDGTSNNSRWICSGTTLMDLETYAAHKIIPQAIEGTDYLFIEAGGFGPKNPAGWQPQPMVLKRN
jgi:hypothetical protein